VTIAKERRAGVRRPGGQAALRPMRSRRGERNVYPDPLLEFYDPDQIAPSVGITARRNLR